MGKKALILSGGSIKGAFEAGAIKAIFEKGFRPDVVYGISIGALNASYLVNRTGQLNNQFDWVSVAQDLIDFWTEHAQRPRDIIRINSIFKLAYQIVTKHFVSLIDMKPLHQLIRRTLDLEALRRSKIGLEVGAVNLHTGEIEYFSPQYPYFIDAVIASTAIPVLMPYVMINGVPYVDGGLRDVVPMRPLLNNHEVTEIVVVICHPEKLSETNFYPGDLIKYIDRTKNITVNEIVKDDIRLIDKLNEVATAEHQIKYTIIRPETEIRLTIDRFSSDDIRRLIDWGYRAAQEAMKDYQTVDTPGLS